MQSVVLQIGLYWIHFYVMTFSVLYTAEMQEIDDFQCFIHRRDAINPLFIAHGSQTVGCTFFGYQFPTVCLTEMLLVFHALPLRQCPMRYHCHSVPCDTIATVSHAIRLPQCPMRYPCHSAPCSTLATVSHARPLLQCPMRYHCHSAPCDTLATVPHAIPLPQYPM